MIESRQFIARVLIRYFAMKHSGRHHGPLRLDGGPTAGAFYLGDFPDDGDQQFILWGPRGVVALDFLHDFGGPVLEPLESFLGDAPDDLRSAATRAAIAWHGHVTGLGWTDHRDWSLVGNVVRIRELADPTPANVADWFNGDDEQLPRAVEDLESRLLGGESIEEVEMAVGKVVAEMQRDEAP